MFGENAKMVSDNTGRIKTTDLLLLGLILAVFAAWTFLLPPIWNHGEAREGLVVQDIVRSHHWILPYRNGEVPSKPPLFHWIAAPLAFLFGPSDFTVRLPSVIAVEVMAITTFLLGMAMGGRKTAWLAVGALLGMYQFWVSGTEARVDMLFAACVTVSIAGFFFWYRDTREAARATCYLASACAVLAKGPVGIALPGLVIVGFLAVERRLPLLWKFVSWPLIGVALFIDLGWYALAYHIGGSQFIAWQIMHENIDQLFGTHGFSSNKTTLSMLGWIPTRTFPWNLALLWGLIRRLRGEREDSTGRFLHVWWIAITAFFFLVNIKRAVYLLPTYPAIALLAARAIAGAIASAESSREDSMQKIPAAAAAMDRILRSPKRLAIAVALLDLALILPNPMVWKRAGSYKATVAFVEEIGAIVPTSSPLFAAPELRSPNLMIIAYRLQRVIERRPITCAGPNDYFLSPLKSPDLAGVQTRLLAASEDNNVALVTVLAPQEQPCPSAAPAVDEEEESADSD